MNKWILHGMLITTVILTWLFFLPGRGFSLQYTYPQNEDCGIQLLSSVTGFSTEVIYFKVGHNWTWYEDFERVFRGLGIFYDYQPLTSKLLQSNKRVLILYQAQWYEVLEYIDIIGWRGYKVNSIDGGDGYIPAKWIEGTRVMVVER